MLFFRGPSRAYYKGFHMLPFTWWHPGDREEPGASENVDWGTTEIGGCRLPFQAEKVYLHGERGSVPRTQSGCHEYPSAQWQGTSNPERSCSYKCDATNIHPLNDKEQAIQNIPGPTNVTELNITCDCETIKTDFCQTCKQCQHLFTYYCVKRQRGSGGKSRRLCLQNQRNWWSHQMCWFTMLERRTSLSCVMRHPTG